MLTKFQCRCSKERSICELMVPQIHDIFIRNYVAYEAPVIQDENERIEWTSPMVFKESNYYSEFDYPLPEPKQQEQHDYFAMLYDYCSPQSKEARGKPTYHEDKSTEIALMASNPHATLGDVLAAVLGTDVFGSAASQFWRLDQAMDDGEERSPKRHKSGHRQSQQPNLPRNHRVQSGAPRRQKTAPIQPQVEAPSRINFDLLEQYVYSSSTQGPNNNIPRATDCGNNTNVMFQDGGNFLEDVMAL